MVKWLATGLVIGSSTLIALNLLVPGFLVGILACAAWSYASVQTKDMPLLATNVWIAAMNFISVTNHL